MTIMAAKAIMPVKVPAKFHAQAPPELKGSMSFSSGISSKGRDGPKIKELLKTSH